MLSPHRLGDHERIVLNPRVSRFSYRRRIAQRTIVDAESSDIGFVNTHLASDSAPDERAAQATAISEWIAAASQGNAAGTILTGDLNADDEPTTLAPFAAVGLHDTWPGTTPGHTNPAGRVRQRIDYVLAGEGWETIDASVAPDGPTWASLSDHLPVVVRLRRITSDDGVEPPQIRSK